MNFAHEEGMQNLLDLIRNRQMPIHLRRQLLDAIDKLQHGQTQYEERIRDLEQLLLRNPAFPDDLVGWWNDDASYPDDDEEDES